MDTRWRPTQQASHSALTLFDPITGPKPEKIKESMFFDSIFSNIWPLAQPNIAENLVARSLALPPAGKLWISGIQKVETLILVILDPN